MSQKQCHKNNVMFIFVCHEPPTHDETHSSMYRDSPPELCLSHYGLEGEENKLFRTEGMVSGLTQPEATLAEIVEYLEKVYCRTMSLEVSQVNVSQ